LTVNTADYEIFEAGDLELQSGETLRGAKLAYKTHGRLNTHKDNVVVFPTFFGGRHTQNEGMVGEGRALDPGKYFIIVPNLFGNGVSSSPSNAAPPYNRARFPGVSLYDNVACQHRLVTEVFGIEKIALVTGWSMGAQQAYQWGALYPEMVERIVPVCGSAKTSRHNFVFLEGVKSAITADSAWAGGSYEKPPLTGLRAMGRVYAGWAVSQAFYREEVYLDLGYESLDRNLNPHYTHSWGFTIEPTVHTGLLAMYPGVDAMEHGESNYLLSLGVANTVSPRINGTAENVDRKTLLAGLTYLLPESLGPLGGSVFSVGYVNGRALTGAAAIEHLRYTATTTDVRL